MVKHLEDLSRILDPQLVLKRGFSITRLNGRTIGDHNAPEPGQDISIETFSEQLTAKLTAIETKKEE
jgi:exonuclease VII large subunit